ncbi:hypothetical protein CPC08DRAFT_708554 [Agrocybe pediades]|nr:hypothetical protein CPC08DRAFT_708554 [Agrocybe pediades]
MSLPDLNALPATLELGGGCTMTFLRNEPYLTRVHVAAIPASQGGTLYVPPHWHEEHDELFRVLQGRLRVMIGDKTRDYVPSDGEIRIPKGMVHSISAFHNEETIFEERTDPMDIEKELFFRNILAGGKMTTHPLQAMVVMYSGDMVPALPGHFKWMERGFRALLGGFIGPLFGYQVKYKA